MDMPTVTLHDFVVVSNEPAAAGIGRLRLASEAARTIAPGQFMNLQVPGDAAHILRIPLSFSEADAQAGEVELLYAVVGEGTERLSRMRAGDTSTLVGPCGQGWWLPETPGRALLVAGGIGLPPVLAAGRMLAARGIGLDLVVGTRTKDMVLWDDLDAAARLVDDGGRIVICTDDGTVGIHGFVTGPAADLLRERVYAQVYTCGPHVMMAGLAKLAHEHGVPCQVSMERMMGCGFGACSCCNVPLAAGGYALCCQDGPVFDAREVAW